MFDMKYETQLSGSARNCHMLMIATALHIVHWIHCLEQIKMSVVWCMNLYTPAQRSIQSRQWVPRTADMPGLDTAWHNWRWDVEKCKTMAALAINCWWKTEDTCQIGPYTLIIFLLPQKKRWWAQWCDRSHLYWYHFDWTKNTDDCPPAAH